MISGSSSGRIGRTVTAVPSRSVNGPISCIWYGAIASRGWPSMEVTVSRIASSTTLPIISTRSRPSTVSGATMLRRTATRTRSAMARGSRSVWPAAAIASTASRRLRSGTSSSASSRSTSAIVEGGTARTASLTTSG